MLTSSIDRDLVRNRRFRQGRHVESDDPINHRYVDDHLRTVEEVSRDRSCIGRTPSVCPRAGHLDFDKQAP
jgi:hypothetical protein